MRKFSRMLRNTSMNQELLKALRAIAEMKVTETTDHAQLCALQIAIAKYALDRAAMDNDEAMRGPSYFGS